MSFVVGEITFYEPSDHTLITNPASIQGLWAYNGNTNYRFDKSAIGSTHTHLIIQGVTNQILRMWGTGDTTLQAGKELWLYTVGSPMKINTQGGQGIITFGSMSLATTTGHIYVVTPATKYVDLTVQSLRLSPAGTGKNVYADSFVVWSSRAIKKDISPIFDAIDRLKAVSSKKYKIEGEEKEKIGFIMEECPESSTESHYDTDLEKVVGGVSTMYFIGILWEALKEVLARLETIEKKVK